MFNFLRKKDTASPTAPPDPTGKWIQQVQQLMTHSTGIREMLGLAPSSAQQQQSGTAIAPGMSPQTSSTNLNNNTNIVTTPTKSAAAAASSSAASPTSFELPDDDDVKLVTANDREAGPEFEQAMYRITEKYAALRTAAAAQVTSLDESLFRLKEHAENIAAAFAQAREVDALRAEIAAEKKKNEGLTIESETARQTVVELMQKIRKLSPNAAKAAQEQQNDLRVQIEVQIKEQRHKAELEKLKQQSELTQKQLQEQLEAKNRSASEQQQQHVSPEHADDHDSNSKQGNSPSNSNNEGDNKASALIIERLQNEIDSLHHELHSERAGRRDAEADLNARHKHDLEQAIAHLNEKHEAQMENLRERLLLLDLKLLASREETARSYQRVDEADGWKSDIEDPLLHLWRDQWRKVSDQKQRLQVELTENTRQMMQLQAQLGSPKKESKGLFSL